VFNGSTANSMPLEVSNQKARFILTQVEPFVPWTTTPTTPRTISESSNDLTCRQRALLTGASYVSPSQMSEERIKFVGRREDEKMKHFVIMDSVTAAKKTKKKQTALDGGLTDCTAISLTLTVTLTPDFDL